MSFIRMLADGDIAAWLTAAGIFVVSALVSFVRSGR